jgi:luciferase-like monooxygenase
MTQTASEKIVERVTTWPGVEARPGRGGELAFVIEQREIGRLHGSRSAHFGSTRRAWERRIDTDDDVEDVIAELRLHYDRAVRAHEHSPRSN